MTDSNGTPRPDPYAAPPVPPAYSPQRTGAGPVAAPPGTDYPGKTLGIVGLILAFVFQLAGLICSIIALNQSRRAGYKNGIALAGIIVSAGLIVLGIIVAIVFVAIIAAACSSGATFCTTTY
ncbi:hypothetical protein GCM10027052_20720 [Parafrigoribacterium mesophilum]|uniref:DUF4190 domain-containing protein n=1 Tax=Parafrigoribacterium mesophilum TaxID=433646 RepID=UPI0031FBD8F3